MSSGGGAIPPLGEKKKKATVKKASAAGAGTKAKAPKKASAGTGAPRQKRPPSAGGGGGGGATVKRTTQAQAESILNEAALAHHTLAKQRSQAAARRLDPFWYRIEDVVALSHGSPPDQSRSATLLPEQASIVERALSHCHMTAAQVTPQAMACLLEQARRFAQELVASAHDYAYAAGRPEVAVPDLVLAHELQASTGSSHHGVATNVSAVASQVPKLNLVAQQVNRIPLPPIPTHCYTGVVLPPVPHALTARTFDVVSAARTRSKMVHALPVVTPRAGASSGTNTPGYGASRSRAPIPIVLKGTTDVTSGSGTAAAAAAGGTSMPMDTTPAQPSTAVPSQRPGDL